MSAAKTKQYGITPPQMAHLLETLLIADAPPENRDPATGDNAGAPEGKAKPGTSGPLLNWNLPPCDDYAVWVIGIRKNGTLSHPIQPDFEPRNFSVKTRENKANGNDGAKQAMWGRAALFAADERIAGAFVVRSANPAKGTAQAIWRVFGNGGGLKEVERIEI